MTEKFQNKYRIPSARLQNWDYGSDAAYFITICTQNRECYFGNIADQKMALNNSARIAENIWCEIPNQFPYSGLGNFIVMPNHVHGILIINKSDDFDNVNDVNVETRLIASLPSTAPSKPPGGITGIKNPMINQNISRIIRWYKGRCTFEIRKTQTDFGWQSRFHDHVIRNDTSFQNISQYIIDNPKNWNADTFYEHS